MDSVCPDHKTSRTCFRPVCSRFPILFLHCGFYDGESVLPFDYETVVLTTQRQLHRIYNIEGMFRVPTPEGKVLLVSVCSVA